jgi:cytochrome c biogenesis protein CcmG/thiol:disulfide interchange protein DsbE
MDLKDDLKDEVRDGVKKVASDAQHAQELLAEPTVLKPRSRKRSITIFIVVSILNAALLILLWTQLLTPAQNASLVQSSASDSGLGDVSSPLIGKPAPDFTLAKLSESGNLRLSDFKGKPVILNFWASWCDPCNAEASFLQKTWATRLQKQGAVLIGIDGQEKASAAQAFLQKYKIGYPNVQDTLDGSIGIRYGVAGFPTTIFIDRNGTVVAKSIAALDEKALEQELKKLHLS